MAPWDVPLSPLAEQHGGVAGETPVLGLLSVVVVQILAYFCLQLSVV